MPASWTQVYYPWGPALWPLSTLAAALPVVVLFTFLLKGARPHIAAIAGALTALVCSMAVFGMPAPLALASFSFGGAFGLLRICWIVLNAVFLYDITVASGQFDIMRASVTSISADRRLQALLIAFSFGAFIEGAAGFGAPVAISAAMMAGLGFNPFKAAALCLIANTAPVAFGALGTPIHTLALVSGLNESDLSAMNARILPLISPIVAFWLVRAMVPWKQTFQVLPGILVTGLSFGVVQFYWGNYQDSNLVDIMAAMAALLATGVFLRFWHPKEIWRFPEERGTAVVGHDYTRKQVLKAWMPFVILTLFVLLWGFIQRPLDSYTRIDFQFPVLHNAVWRDAPVVSEKTPETAVYRFAWLTATGTAAFFSAVLSGLLLGMGPRRIFQIFRHTVYRMRFALTAIFFMLGLAYVTRYSGMDAVLGLAFTRTGAVYPFFAAFLGWLGVALTGSDTSSNALFGSLQRITAEQLSLDPILITSANSTGGVMGKMIDAQSIVVAAAATNIVGREGELLRYVFWTSVALVSVVGVIIMLYAYVFPQFVPHGLTFMQ